MKNEIKSTAHSKYRCEYHIVFAPKYRRKEIYGQLKKDIGEILRKLCEQKGVEIIEAEACPDHIHMLVSVPPYLSIAQFMGFLKGKSSLMIFDRHANLKYKYDQRSFWCRGYFVDTVGKNETAIRNYIRNQLEEDYAKDQIRTKLIRVRCMNVYAKQRGVVLSRVQKENVENAAKEYLEKLSDDKKNSLGLTQEKMEKMFTEFAVAKTLFDDMTSTIVDEISADDARVINVQYIVCDNQNDITAAKQELDDGEVFYSVMSKYSNTTDYECVLKRGEMDEAFEKAAFDLKSGEVSKIVSADEKYYIIKCVSDNEKAKTEANKASIADEKKLAYFNEAFKDFETSIYVEFNNKVWKNKSMSGAAVLDVNFSNIFESYFGK